MAINAILFRYIVGPNEKECIKIDPRCVDSAPVDKMNHLSPFVEEILILLAEILQILILRNRGDC